ncbi:MAG: WD40 repeat domain-containing protein, partial [Magnetococcales bacterium]|nr:WD40 repeat domain-containing protein [Magnetococcales bacterium]
EAASEALAAYEQNVSDATRLLDQSEPFKALECLTNARAQKGFSRGSEAMEAMSRIALSLPRQGFSGGWETTSAPSLESPSYAVAIDHTGTRALSGDEHGKLTLWDVVRGEISTQWPTEAGDIRCVAFGMDGKSVLLGSAAGGSSVLQLWDLPKKKLLASMNGHTRPVLGLALSSDGQWALSAGADGDVRQWDLEQGRCLRRYQGQGGQVFAVALLPDGEHFVSGDEDGAIRLWRLGAKRCKAVWRGHRGQVFSLAVSADGQSICSAGSDHLVIIWDIKSGRPRQALQGHSGFIRAVVMTADGGCALSASSDGTLRLWELTKGTLLRSFAGNHGPFHNAALSGDSQRLVTTGADHTVHFWQLDWRYSAPPDATWDPRAERLMKLYLKNRRNRLRAISGIPQKNRSDLTLSIREAATELRTTLGESGLGWISEQTLKRHLSDAMRGNWYTLSGLMTKLRR